MAANTGPLELIFFLKNKEYKGPTGGMIQDETDPLYGEILRDLKIARKDLVFGKTRNHQCSNKECSPMSNGHNVYLCKYGVVHICSPSRCEYYARTQNKTCPLTGIVLETAPLARNTYDKNDSRTWTRETDLVVAIPDSEVVKKRNIRHSPSDATLQLTAENIVTNLLYSSNRSNRNNATIAFLKEKAKKARQTYVNERFKNRQLPYLSDLCRITTSVFSQELPYILYAHDEISIRYYAFIVLQIWAVVQKYAVPHKDKVFDPDTQKEIVPRMDFEAVALAVIYAMREGLEYGGTVALPTDVFLIQNLPHLNDLDAYFSLSQNKVTRGTSLLLSVYNNARNDGASTKEVCLDLSLLPQRDEQSRFKKIKTEV